MKASEQIFTSRLLVMLIFFVSLSIALNFSGNFLSLGSFSLSIACQMLVPLIALCYFSWFTKHGIASGLVVGIIAYIAYNYLVTKVEKVIFQMEARTTEFLDHLHQTE